VTPALTAWACALAALAGALASLAVLLKRAFCALLDGAAADID
jgi:hypothetical protein